MTIYFYNNTSEINEFPKLLSNVIEVTGNLKDSCDILNPVITFKNNNNLQNFNYAQIKEFNRFYFVDYFEFETDELINIYFSIDVLQTYANQIKQCNAYIGRNEHFIEGEVPDSLKYIYEKSKYINDNNIQVLPTYTENIIFGTTSGTALSITTNSKYVLCVSGTGVTNVTEPARPTLRQSALHSSNCYILNEVQLSRFMQFCYDNDFFTTLFPSYVNPQNAVILLYECPFDIPTGSSAEIIVGKNTKGDMVTGSLLNTTISSNLATFNITLNDNEKHNNFLDFNPYTSYHLYLPFFGFIDVDNNIILNYSIKVVYSFDATTATLYVRVNYYNENTADTLLFENSCFCGTVIPISGIDYSSFNRNIVSTVLSAGITVGTGTIMSGLASQQLANTYIAGGIPTEPLSKQEYSQRLRSGLTGSESAVGQSRMREARRARIETTKQQGLVKTAGQTLQGLSNLATLDRGIFSQSYQSGNACYASLRRVFLQVRKYDTFYPANYGKLVGYPVENTMNIGSLTGFTQINEIHIENYFGNATKQEIIMLNNLLKEGVIIR